MSPVDVGKNSEGYKNLIKLCSLGYMEGMYSKYPRIDKELVLKYHKGLIATTCCLAAEVPRLIIKKGRQKQKRPLNGGSIYLVMIIILSCKGTIFPNRP